MILDSILGRTYFAPDEAPEDGGGTAVADEPSPYDFDDGTEDMLRRRVVDDEPAETAEAETPENTDTTEDTDGVETPAAVETGTTAPPVQPATPPPVRSAVPQYDEALVKRAFQLGLRPADVAPLLDKPMLLNEAVAAREAEVQQYWEQQRREQEAQQAAQRPDQFAAIKQKMLASGYAEDDPLLGVFEEYVRQQEQQQWQLQNHFQQQLQETAGYFQQQLGQVDALSQQHQQLSQQAQQALAAQQQAEMLAVVDKYFGDQPEEWRDTFGSGGLKDLPQNSPQFQNRTRVLEIAGALARGGFKGTREQLLEYARNAAFGNQSQTIARKRVADQARAANGQFTARPSAAVPPEERLTGEQKATQRWAKFLERRGLPQQTVQPDPVV